MQKPLFGAKKRFMRQGTRMQSLMALSCFGSGWILVNVGGCGLFKKKAFMCLFHYQSFFKKTKSIKCKRRTYKF